MRKYLYGFISSLILLAALGSAQSSGAPAQQTLPESDVVYLPIVEDTFNCSNVEQIPVSECRALQQFFWLTNDLPAGGAGWLTAYGWFQNAFPCDWSGISCSTQGRHVIGLHVGYNNLTGTIPSV
ncbi:MAG: hypothetical protein R2873_03405 [Caldilineaceae bacterium]